MFAYVFVELEYNFVIGTLRVSPPSHYFLLHIMISIEFPMPLVKAQFHSKFFLTIYQELPQFSHPFFFHSQTRKNL